MTSGSWKGALRAIAAGSLGQPPQRVEIDATEMPELLDAISRQRLTGLAVDAVQRGDLEVSTTDLGELLDRHEEQLALDLQLKRLLCEAADALDGAGVPYRALKGPMLAHTVYRDPSLRSFGDVDVLVPGFAFDAAIDTLRPLGFRRRFIEPRPGFDARFSKGACLERADGMEVDLHRTLAPGAFGVMLGRADLFARPAAHFDLGGRPIAGLDRELAFVHACFHAALGDDPPRLAPLRDVAELIVTGFDAAVVRELAARVRCEAVLQRAIGLVEIELGLRFDDELNVWVRSYRTSPFDRRALNSYVGARRSYAGQAAVSLWALPSMRARVSYASALAFPSREYVRARESGYVRRVRRSVHLVQAWRPR